MLQKYRTDTSQETDLSRVILSISEKIQISQHKNVYQYQNEA
jgi:hypothetical protein